MPKILLKNEFVQGGLEDRPQRGWDKTKFPVPWSFRLAIAAGERMRGILARAA
jgi:hypothetical protein